MGHKYETHMHTMESSACGKATARDQAEQYKKNGYSGIIITDHLNERNFWRGGWKRFVPLITWKQKVDFMVRGYQSAKEIGDMIELDVFFGWEYRYNGCDFLTYGLGYDFLITHPNLHKMPLNEYSELVHANGGFIAQAHPYRNKASGHRFNTPVDPIYIDSMEVFNASRIGIGSENIKAMNFASEHHIITQAGTDSHRINRPFYSGIELPEKATTIFDIISSIKNKSCRMILQ